MKITVKVLVVCVLLCSCQKTKTELNKKSTSKETLVGQKENLDSIKEIKKKPNYEVKIKFPDLIISMIDVDVNGLNGIIYIDDNNYETKKDTASFELIPGDWMENKTFKVEPASFDEIELYGQFEIKMGLTTHRDTDSPFVVIEDWKSYTSEWEKLDINQKDLKFIVINDTIDHPIDFTIDELKTAVKEHCNSIWFDEIKNIKTLKKMPVSFFTTRYVYKIRAKNTKTNEIIERYIVFYTPTSC